MIFLQKKIGSINIAWGYLLLKETDKKFEDKKVFFDFSDGSKIEDFSNITTILY